MDRYIDEKCPVCSKPFNSGDDIVVCPQCGTPHHRECWFEKGECANKALHKEGYTWGEEKGQKVDKSFDENNVLGNICPRCGTNNPPDSLFCSKCGLPKGENPNNQNIYNNVPPFIHSENFYSPYGFPNQFSPEDKIDDIPAIEVAEYVSANSKRYVGKFMKGKKIGWNWGAFIFGPYWFFFRKLTKIGLAFLAIALSFDFLFSALMGDLLSALSQSYYDLLNGVITQQTAFSQIIDILNTSEQTGLLVLYTAITLLLRIIMALFADYLYKKVVIERIQKMRQSAQNSSMYHTMLMVKGGVSFLMAFLAIFLEYSFVVLVQYLIFV